MSTFCLILFLFRVNGHPHGKEIPECKNVEKNDLLPDRMEFGRNHFVESALSNFKVASIVSQIGMSIIALILALKNV